VEATLSVDGAAVVFFVSAELLLQPASMENASTNAGNSA